MSVSISTVIHTGRSGQFGPIVYISDKEVDRISEVSRTNILRTKFEDVSRGCYERDDLPNKFTIITTSTQQDPVTKKDLTIGEQKIEYAFSDKTQYLQEEANGNCLPFNKDELKTYVNGHIELWDDISQKRIFLGLETTSWIKMRKLPIQKQSRPYLAIACLLTTLAVVAFCFLKPEMIQAGFNSLKSMRKA